MNTDEKQSRKESQSARGYELSDAEKRDLIALIQAGKPLPERYRFLLFADKREVELVWNGKTRDVCTAILPFQTLEHIDEPRKEKHEENQLVGFDASGRQAKGWTNKLIWGDNKLILSSLKSGALQGTHHVGGAFVDHGRVDTVGAGGHIHALAELRAGARARFTQQFFDEFFYHVVW